MRVAAVVLTAGRSRRMGRAKAWLEIEGETLLARIARIAAAAGVAPVVVVAGSADDDGTLVSREQITARLTVAVDVAIGAPDAHPIDSLRAGLALVPAECAVLLWPVDHPFAEKSLLDAMSAALGDEPDRVIVPDVGGDWGHPVLLGPTVVAELRSPLADPGAHRVVHRVPERIVRLPASDPRLVAELNTPEQAAAHGVRLPV